MRFIDEAEIKVEAGRGGDGCASFLHESRNPLGGPNGGNGGDGGDVLIEVDGGLLTLMDFRYRRHFRAGRGGHGSSKDRAGRGGAPCVFPVPPGTTVYDAGTGEMIADLLRDGETFVCAKGGRGGRGNAAFATSTRRTPRRREIGKPGEARKLRLVLRLLSEVGIIGVPNAGKSTLIERMSNAKPKIADYPFTTLHPNIGVAAVGDVRFTVADLPGLVAGAAEGRGLGHRFLRHVERTGLLLHLIAPGPGSTPAEEYKTLRRELGEFDPVLLEKDEIVVLNKIDTHEGKLAAAAIHGLLGCAGRKIFTVSALTGEGVDELLDFLAEKVDRVKGRVLQSSA